MQPRRNLVLALVAAASVTIVADPSVVSADTTSDAAAAYKAGKLPQAAELFF